MSVLPIISNMAPYRIFVENAFLLIRVMGFILLKDADLVNDLVFVGRAHTVYNCCTAYSNPFGIRNVVFTEFPLEMIGHFLLFATIPELKAYRKADLCVKGLSLNPGFRLGVVIKTNPEKTLRLHLSERRHVEYGETWAQFDISSMKHLLFNRLSSRTQYRNDYSIERLSAIYSHPVPI